VSRPRPTVRARLTVLYTGLFAACGAIVVAVSYALVARLGTPAQGQQPPSRASVAAGITAQCRPKHPGAHPDKNLMAQCISYLQQQGAQAQRGLTLSHLLQYSLITLAVVIGLAAILGWIAAGRALRPVHQITAAARAASDRNLSARVAPTGPRDELRELAETFDQMLGRLQAAFEAQQRFIANASHELRTPLAVMRATVDVVLGNPDTTPDDLRGMATDIRAAVGHAEHLIGALLILARNERGLTVREEIDLATVAEDVLDTVAPGDRRVHATLEPAVISGDPVLAERLLANLIDNAVRYNIAKGDIWVTTRTTAGSSQLTVANTGPVISPADARRIFQPFQRLSDRTSHDGSGLGLALVASIAAIHGGTATARPRDNSGLTVTVTIPSPATPVRDTSTRATSDPVSRAPG
jgi:signal transduction histidine kinase